MPSILPGTAWPAPTAGVLAHLNPLDVPPTGLVSAENWVLRNGRVQVREGLARQGDVKDRPMGLWEYNHEQEDRRVMCGGTTQVWCWSPTLEVWRRILGPTVPLSGGITCHVIMRDFNVGGETLIIGCNGRDPMWKWDGDLWGGSELEVLGAPPVVPGAVRCFMKLFDRLLVCYNSPVNATVAHSNNLDPDTGYEEEAILGETPGEIVACLEVGNFEGVIYKETSIYKAYAQDDVLAPFRYQLVAAGVPGPCSPAAVAHLPDGSQVFLSRSGDLSIFDGAAVRSAGPHIQAWLQAHVSQDLIERSFLFVDPERNEIWVFFADEASDDVCTAALITWPDYTLWPMRYASDRFISCGRKTTIPSATKIGELVGTIGDQQLTIGEYANLHGSLLLGEVGGVIYEAAAMSDDGEPITTHLETGFTPLGDPRRFKLVQEVEWWFDLWFDPDLGPGVVGVPPGVVGVPVVSVGWSSYGEPRKLSAPKTVPMGARHRTQHRVVGRQFCLRLDIRTASTFHYDGAQVMAVERSLR